MTSILPPYMRTLLIGFFMSLATQCYAADKTSTPTQTALLKPGVRSCLEAAIEEQAIKWCVLHRPYAPSEHTVSIGPVVAFSGKDDEAVSFSKQVAGQNYIGSCSDEMAVLGIKTMSPAALTSVPEKQIEACAIAADSSGKTKPFVMTRRCEESIGGNQLALAPEGARIHKPGPAMHDQDNFYNCFRRHVRL
jgi:hypothetical protein